MNAIGAPGSIARLRSERPEPTTSYNVSTRTPWGTAQSATYFGKGIIQYSTASHGGFHVSAALLERIPEYLQNADQYAPGTAGWFEEDCAWAIVAVCFPERFSAEVVDDAERTMRSTYPAEWVRFEAETRQDVVRAVLAL